MRINSVRSVLYFLGRLLGDVNAVQKHKVGRRIERRIVGRLLGQLMRAIFK